jgi:UDP-N-acetylmuramate: L-alanyl-gamma-D-glutamyl-meso-diaminopimelate ligase
MSADHPLESQRIHFIAVGGAAMHNLAIALKRAGHNVTGSDDQIHEPSRGRLEREGLLPEKMGWDAERITVSLDRIVLGMHAREDNPELAAAMALGLKVVSYPEFLYEAAAHQRRIVIAGSHGKTTITGMVLHVMSAVEKPVDYMVGAQLQGFDCMVQLSEADTIVIEGDEYLSSPQDLTPKFHHYRPHVALVSGIAWDHCNVFPTDENYKGQFTTFLRKMEPSGTVVWCEEDEALAQIVDAVKSERPDLDWVPYSTPAHRVEGGLTVLEADKCDVALKMVGAHNVLNMAGARSVCEALGVSGGAFIDAIADFEGAAGRLERIEDTAERIVFRDFAHAPSKVTATTQSVRDQFPDAHLIACFELHTFSSLSKSFLPQYADSLQGADASMVFYSPAVVKQKRLPAINEDDIRLGFRRADLVVTTAGEQIDNWLAKAEEEAADGQQIIILWMSSGRFDGVGLLGKKTGNDRNAHSG